MNTTCKECGSEVVGRRSIRGQRAFTEAYSCGSVCRWGEGSAVLQPCPVPAGSDERRAFEGERLRVALEEIVMILYRCGYDPRTMNGEAFSVARDALAASVVGETGPTLDEFMNRPEPWTEQE